MALGHKWAKRLKGGKRLLVPFTHDKPNISSTNGWRLSRTENSKHGLQCVWIFIAASCCLIKKIWFSLGFLENLINGFEVLLHKYFLTIKNVSPGNIWAEFGNKFSGNVSIRALFRLISSSSQTLQRHFRDLIS